jgi:drug/metabolite transporter (DMT)-like permease
LLKTAPLRVATLASFAMIAFAGNSLLCRAALKQSSIDAASFTAIRLLSGALMLWLVVRWKSRSQANVPNAPKAPEGRKAQGSWPSAIALFVYAAGFSFAYVSMSAATGALLLFGAVQATMIGFGIYKGERLRVVQLAGFLIAIAGLVVLMLPGLATPSLLGSLCMLSAGVAWGIYSLRGKRAGDPTRVTAGNFLRTAPVALVALVLVFAITRKLSVDNAGMTYAILSGAITSGLGYAIWYEVLPALKATVASTVQLSVPVIAALGGIVFLSEPITLSMVAASAAILGGIALVILNNR